VTIQAGDGGGALSCFLSMFKRNSATGKIPIDVTFDGVPDKTSIRYSYPHLAGVPKAIRERSANNPAIRSRSWCETRLKNCRDPGRVREAPEKEKFGILRSAQQHAPEGVRALDHRSQEEETRKARFEKAIMMLKQR
jgi:hypothetical protein